MDEPQSGGAYVTPPPAPREIADSYARRLLMADGWAVGSMIIAMIGGIFAFVGIILTFGIITAFVGIPFTIFGGIALGLGLASLSKRHRHARQVVEVLRNGEPVEGRIESVEENTMVRINGRHPWAIRYRFRLDGIDYEGSVSTQNPPSLQPGGPACVLYLPGRPEFHALYPHP
jgi:membrane protein implicated in regulation of membrane protease activity